MTIKRVSPIRASPKKIKRKPTTPAKKFTPLWELYRDGVTQGFIKTYLECPEQARLKYVEGLSQKGVRQPLVIGDAFHHLLESSATSKSSGRFLNKYSENWYRETNATRQEQSEFDKNLALVETMHHYYLKWWAIQESKYVWVAKEKTFREDVFVPGLPEDYPPLKAIVSIRGKWDGLFRTSKKGGLWLQETKTKSRIDEAGMITKLMHDIQTWLYVYAANHHYKEPIAGVLYNVARVPQLRQGASEPWAKFLARVKKDIESRPQFYFMRWRVEFEKGDMHRWAMRFLFPTLRRIVLWNNSIKDWENPWQSPYHFYNPDAFDSRFNTKSEFFEIICNPRASRFRYYRRSKAYPELAE